MQVATKLTSKLTIIVLYYQGVTFAATAAKGLNVFRKSFIRSESRKPFWRERPETG